MKWLIIVLLLISYGAHAEAYRWINEKGEVVFSDSPPPEQTEFEAVDLPPAPKIQSVKPPKFTTNSGKPNNSDQSADENKTLFYKGFHISNPSNDQTIRANDGSISVSIALPAGLIRGDTLNLLLDGKQVADSNKAKLTLNEISRGTHKLTAIIKSRSGKTLQSDSITFHLLRGTVAPSPAASSNSGS